MAVRCLLFRGLVKEVEEDINKYLSTHHVHVLHMAQSETGDHISVTLIVEEPEPLSEIWDVARVVMADRVKPPDDITPHEFFTRWIPESVARDASRRARLRDTQASLVFRLTGNPGGEFTIQIASGEVRGVAGGAADPDLEVTVDVETWRQLNAGEISAPEALLRRRVKLHGDFLLALKLHLILG